jgi:hypothetical protein
VYKPGARQKFLLGCFRQSCKHVSWCHWSLMQMTHYCANQRRVLNLNKAEIKKSKVEDHKHGFLTEFYLSFCKKNKRIL